MRFERCCSALTVALSVAAAGPGAILAAGPTDMAATDEPTAGAWLPFFSNEGQFAPSVQYATRSGAAELSVSSTGTLVYSVRNPERGRSSVLLRETIGPGTSRVLPGSQSPTRASFFIGAERTRWRHNLTTFDSVRLDSVYPGVSVVLASRPVGVEKVFAISPGASVETIQMQLDGHESVSVAADGRLAIDTHAGTVHFSAPIAWQTASSGRISVAVDWRVDAHDRYGFDVGDYDRSLPLMVDPILQTTFVGGEGIDNAIALATGTDGAVYTAGFTESMDFMGGGSGAPPGDSSTVGFIARFDADLQTLERLALLGGTQNESAIRALLIDTDDGGETVIWAAGDTTSGTFPDCGVVDGGSALVARFDADLAQLNATCFGGDDDVSADVLAVDRAGGQVYVAGQTSATDLPGAASGAQPTPLGFLDAFVAVIPDDLSGVTRSTYLGSAGFVGTGAGALAVGGNPTRVYLAGSAGGPLAGTDGAARPDYASSGDGFVTQFSADLTSIVRTTFLGGLENDSANDVVLFQDRVIVAGITGSTDFPITPGASQAVLNGNRDAFVAVLDDDLTTLTEATFLGGSEADAAESLLVQSDGSLYVAGATLSSDFPATAGGAQATNGGADDLFLAYFAADPATGMPALGTDSLVQATYFGDARSDSNGLEVLLAASPVGTYLASTSSSATLPALSGGARDGAELEEGFVTRLSCDLRALDLVPPVASVLPFSRTVQVGDPATAFFSIVNPNASRACGCGIRPVTAVAAEFAFQTTDVTNSLTGTANQRVVIPGSGIQSFLFEFRPTAAFEATEIEFEYACDTGVVATLPGVNTFSLGASATPAPDIIALSATPSADQTLRLAPAGEATANVGAFSMAAANIGAEGTIDVTPELTGSSPPVALAICETDAQGLCMSALGASVSSTIAGGATPTYTVVADAAENAIEFLPGENRIRVTFSDESGRTVGGTSVAVTTVQL